MNQPIKGIKMAEVASKQTDVRMDVWLGHCKQEADQITDTGDVGDTKAAALICHRSGRVQWGQTNKQVLGDFQISHELL